MMLPLGRVALLAATLAAASSEDVDGLSEQLGALDTDGECAADENGGDQPCALSLRHLRAQRQLAAAASHQPDGAAAAEALASLAAESAADDEARPRAHQVRPLSWRAAYRQADTLMKYMEPSDKAALLRGIGWTFVGKAADLHKWWYVGNVQGNPRLGIPSLNFQDAAGGFRTYWKELVGSVTCWPSLLSLAATWSPESVHEFAVALGQEFDGKGANGILGPSIAVHRVARGGRNFEYLSGDDPYLGSKLAAEYVKGVQSQGVMAVMKHWIFNNQETNRNTYSSIVDKKTAFELYYPPYEAAVRAGVSAAMCSYNKIHGVYSCQNKHELETVLKKRLGFRGFVQTDWWALHSNASLRKGLDMDMPGWPVESYFAHGAPSTFQLAQQSPRAVNGAARRILAAIFRLKLDKTSRCSPPHCESWFLRNVTGPRHAGLARRLAAESIVLLKNEGGILPLSGGGVKTIAVIGSAAVSQPYDPAGQGQGQSDAWRFGDYYSGGGSGHVVAGYVVTPLDGIRTRAAAVGIEVVASPSGNETEAIAAAKKADVAIIVGATTSGESVDRPNLMLDDGVDHLISVVANHTSRTIVLVEAPGAFVMPWRDSVPAILSLFLGGQETGSAWADVLFGDRAPTGRLPIMLPATEADTIPPSTSLRIRYSDGLATSYRNKNFTAAFPFGHGLTYTTFEYASAAPAACPDGARRALLCVAAAVRNAGGAAGKTVAQLYLELPPVAGQPAPFLKGFQSTGLLQPGGNATVTFVLTHRDLSYFNARTSSWTLAASATAHVGESSADIRHTVALAVPRHAK